MTAPRQQLRFSAAPALGCGVPFGVLFGFFTALVGDRPARPWLVVVTVVIAGAAFGLLMERTTRSRRAMARERVDKFTDGLTPSERQLAILGSRRGALPTEPDVRTAAWHIADDRLTQLTGLRVGNIAAPILIMIVTGVFAITRTPAWWTATALMLATLVISAWQRRQARRRCAALATG